MAIAPSSRTPERVVRPATAYCAAGFDLAVLGLDLLPGRARCRPSMTMRSVGREARANDAQSVHDRAELDPLGADRAVVGDREDDLARLIGRDRAVGHQQRLVLAAEQPQPAEEARGQQAILVLEDGAAADGAGLGIEHVVDEIHPALMLVVGLVREPHRDRVLARRATTAARRPRRAAGSAGNPLRCRRTRSGWDRWTR